ncbi:hypothetical protein CEUSTIGMA_g2694.t1 [Chlamydomonas eustigma]|uniref:Uncharacterized protein n=1 Tax=Chlamydomonas eustigma TaxID=1157962 RepID=A0A250WX23_9CHLO|nr:hypothetical protein CEUSTIGMA_g2694.t1 [Chlamydomonas eustigma]|eukprot:GAX75249.1 hypothetical protein CEUSTIGMA_g2694.t1 [Chlamydomonas eustigma]
MNIHKKLRDQSIEIQEAPCSSPIIVYDPVETFHQLSISSDISTALSIDPANPPHIILSTTFSPAVSFIESTLHKSDLKNSFENHQLSPADSSSQCHQLSPADSSSQCPGHYSSATSACSTIHQKQIAGSAAAAGRLQPKAAEATASSSSRWLQGWMPAEDIVAPRQGYMSTATTAEEGNVSYPGQSQILFEEAAVTAAAAAPAVLFLASSDYKLTSPTSPAFKTRSADQSAVTACASGNMMALEASRPVPAEVAEAVPAGQTISSSSGSSMDPALPLAPTAVPVHYIVSWPHIAAAASSCRDSLLLSGLSARSRGHVQEAAEAVTSTTATHPATSAIDHPAASHLVQPSGLASQEGSIYYCSNHPSHPSHDSSPYCSNHPSHPSHDSSPYYSYQEADYDPSKGTNKQGEEVGPAMIHQDEACDHLARVTRVPIPKAWLSEWVEDLQHRLPAVHIAQPVLRRLSNFMLASAANGGTAHCRIMSNDESASSGTEGMTTTTTSTTNILMKGVPIQSEESDEEGQGGGLGGGGGGVTEMKLKALIGGEGAAVGVALQQQYNVAVSHNRGVMKTRSDAGASEYLVRGLQQQAAPAGSSSGHGISKHQSSSSASNDKTGASGPSEHSDQEDERRDSISSKTIAAGQPSAWMNRLNQRGKKQQKGSGALAFSSNVLAPRMRAPAEGVCDAVSDEGTMMQLDLPSTSTAAMSTAAFHDAIRRDLDQLLAQLPVNETERFRSLVEATANTSITTSNALCDESQQLHVELAYKNLRKRLSSLHEPKYTFLMAMFDKEVESAVRIQRAFRIFRQRMKEKTEEERKLWNIRYKSQVHMVAKALSSGNITGMLSDFLTDISRILRLGSNGGAAAAADSSSDPLKQLLHFGGSGISQEQALAAGAAAARRGADVGTSNKGRIMRQNMKQGPAVISSAGGSRSGSRSKKGGGGADGAMALKHLLSRDMGAFQKIVWAKGADEMAAAISQQVALLAEEAYKTLMANKKQQEEQDAAAIQQASRLLHHQNDDHIPDDDVSRLDAEAEGAEAQNKALLLNGGGGDRQAAAGSGGGAQMIAVQPPLAALQRNIIASASAAPTVSVAANKRREAGPYKVGWKGSNLEAVPADGGLIMVASRAAAHCTEAVSHHNAAHCPEAVSHHDLSAYVWAANHESPTTGGSVEDKTQSLQGSKVREGGDMKVNAAVGKTERGDGSSSSSSSSGTTYSAFSQHDGVKEGVGGEGQVQQQQAPSNAAVQQQQQRRHVVKAMTVLPAPPPPRRVHKIAVQTMSQFAQLPLLKGSGGQQQLNQMSSSSSAATAVQQVKSTAAAAVADYGVEGGKAESRIQNLVRAGGGAANMLMNDSSMSRVHWPTSGAAAELVQSHNFNDLATCQRQQQYQYGRYGHKLGLSLPEGFRLALDPLRLPPVRTMAGTTLLPAGDSGVQRKVLINPVTAGINAANTAFRAYLGMNASPQLPSHYHTHGCCPEVDGISHKEWNMVNSSDRQVIYLKGASPAVTGLVTRPVRMFDCCAWRVDKARSLRTIGKGEEVLLFTIGRKFTGIREKLEEKLRISYGRKSATCYVNIQCSAKPSPSENNHNYNSTHLKANWLLSPSNPMFSLTSFIRLLLLTLTVTLAAAACGASLFASTPLSSPSSLSIATALLRALAAAGVSLVPIIKAAGIILGLTVLTLAMLVISSELPVWLAMTLGRKGHRTTTSGLHVQASLKKWDAGSMRRVLLQGFAAIQSLPQDIAQLAQLRHFTTSNSCAAPTSTAVSRGHGTLNEDDSCHAGTVQMMNRGDYCHRKLQPSAEVDGMVDSEELKLLLWERESKCALLKLMSEETLRELDAVRAEASLRMRRNLELGSSL